MLRSELGNGLGKGRGRCLKGSEVLDRLLPSEVFCEDIFQAEQEDIGPELRRKFLPARADATHLPELRENLMQCVVVGEDCGIAAEK